MVEPQSFYFNVLLVIRKLELSQKEGPAPPAMGNVKVDSGLSKSVVDYVALGEKVWSSRKQEVSAPIWAWRA